MRLWPPTAKPPQRCSSVPQVAASWPPHRLAAHGARWLPTPRRHPETPGGGPTAPPFDEPGGPLSKAAAAPAAVCRARCRVRASHGGSGRSTTAGVRRGGRGAAVGACCGDGLRLQQGAAAIAPAHGKRDPRRTACTCNGGGGDATGPGRGRHPVGADGASVGASPPPPEKLLSIGGGRGAKGRGAARRRRDPSGDARGSQLGLAPRPPHVTPPSTRSCLPGPSYVGWAAWL